MRNRLLFITLFCLSLVCSAYCAGAQHAVVNLHASEINETTFKQLAALESNTGGPVRMGAATIFFYLREPHESLRERLMRFLRLSEQYNIPIVVQPAGEQYWGNRPDLWNWWNALPEDKKDLLISVKLGWESSIGVNTFYYPDGNRLLNEPAENDPRYGLNSQQLPARGVVAIGYAAVKTLGLADNGTLKEAHQAEVVQRHLERLCKIASELGVPRDRLFTHVGGWKDGELLYDAANNPYACPGWSFYKHARNPRKDIGVKRAWAASDAPAWGAVEWFPQGAETEQDWYQALHNTLTMDGCRYVCLYNWRSIQNNEAAQKAFKRIVSK